VDSYRRQTDWAKKVELLGTLILAISDGYGRRVLGRATLVYISALEVTGLP